MGCSGVPVGTMILGIVVPVGMPQDASSARDSNTENMKHFRRFMCCSFRLETMETITVTIQKISTFVNYPIAESGSPDFARIARWFTVGRTRRARTPGNQKASEFPTLGGLLFTQYALCNTKHATRNTQYAVLYFPFPLLIPNSFSAIVTASSKIFSPSSTSD